VAHGGGQHKLAPAVVARAHRYVEDGELAVVAADAPGHGDRAGETPFEPVMEEIRAGMAAGEAPGPLFAKLHALMAGHTTPEWSRVLDHVLQDERVGEGVPVGFWGLSMGCALGIPFLVADRRVRAAVLGLAGATTAGAVAEQADIPVEFVLQWDDELVPRADGLALYDSFSSDTKSLHVNPGGHAAVPEFESESAVSFFRRHLAGPGDPA
jgi:hypothetical protein